MPVPGPVGPGPVTSTQVINWLQEPMPDEAVELAIEVSAGWLEDVGCDVYALAAAGPLPRRVWSWWLELAALGAGNPQSLTTLTTGTEVTGAAGSNLRREAILAAARARYGKAPGPRGTFPVALGWPL